MRELTTRGLYQVVTWLLRFGYTHDAALVTSFASVAVREFFLQGFHLLLIKPFGD